MNKNTLKIKLYDLNRDITYEFKNKTQMMIEINCFKDEYQNVVLNKINDYEYEVSYEQ